MLIETKLRDEIVAVLQGVVLHQRARWGTLLGHQRQFEGWWKAEFAVALEAWTWSSRPLASKFGVIVEPKPRDYDAVEWDTRNAADLLVAPWNPAEKRVSYEKTPRLWVEIKTRATWWGGSTSAVGKALAGLRSDLAKWDNLRPDSVLVCHIVTHDGAYDDQLPQEWQDALDNLRAENEARWSWENPFTVGIEVAVRDKLCCRWTRMDCVTVTSAG